MLTEAQSKLMADNYRLLLKARSTWEKKMRLKLTRDEVHDCCTEAMITAALGYDETKGFRFSTFYFKCVENKILTRIKYHRAKMRKATRMISMEARVRNTKDVTVEEVLGDVDKYHFEDIDQLNTAMDVLNENEMKIIHGMYFDDKTQAELGSETNYSQVHVGRIQKTALRKMREVVVYG